MHSCTPTPVSTTPTHSFIQLRHTHSQIVMIRDSFSFDQPLSLLWFAPSLGKSRYTVTVFLRFTEEDRESKRESSWVTVVHHSADRGNSYRFGGLRIRINFERWIRIRIRVKSWIQICVEVGIQELYRPQPESRGYSVLTMEDWRLKN